MTSMGSDRSVFFCCDPRKSLMDNRIKSNHDVGLFFFLHYSNIIKSFDMYICSNLFYRMINGCKILHKIEP